MLATATHVSGVSRLFRNWPGQVGRIGSFQVGDQTRSVPSAGVIEVFAK
jgi:hypothetical protein